MNARRGLVVGVTAVVLLALLVVASLLLPPRRTEQVAVPGVTATPEDVVGAYVTALDAHDCDTARALVAAGSGVDAASWCRDVDHLSRVDVRPHVVEPLDSGRSTEEEVVGVPVTFDLDWRPFHGDASMEEGRTDWGYQLVRDSPGSPWRIDGQGTG